MDIVSFVSNMEVASALALKESYIRDLDPTGKVLVTLALSPYVTFGVKQVPVPKRYARSEPEGGYKLFFDLCDKLAKRQVTGQEALDTIELTLMQYPKATAGALTRVLRKNLRVKATAKTFNKVHPGLVPTFDFMLAKTVDSIEDVEYPVLVEVKYDGMRNIAIVREGVVQHFSRKGLEQPQFAPLDADLLRMRARVRADIVLEGEVMSGTSFQDTMQRGNVDPESLRYHVFDYMSLGEWEHHRCTLPQDRRRDELVQLLTRAQPERVALSKGYVVQNAAEARLLYKEASKEGYDEGLMFKKLLAGYEWCRSSAWLKWKPTKTADLKVVGWHYGKKAGKHEHTVGSLDCVGEDENGRPIRSNVGTGIDEDMRPQLLKLAQRGKLVGITVEVKFDKMTKAKNKDTWSLRFPRVKQLRLDK